MSFLDWLAASFRRKPVGQPCADPRPVVELGEPEWAAAVSQRGQRVVFADWVGLWTVDETGTPFFAERVDLADQVKVTDRRDVNMARFDAAERYPELAHLRPTRAPGAYDCPSCRGTGVLPLLPDTAGRIWCSCGGVCWLPKGYPDPGRGAVPGSGGPE